MFKTWLPILILLFVVAAVGCNKKGSPSRPDAAGVQVKKVQMVAEKATQKPETTPEGKPVETAPDCPTMCAHVVNVVRDGMDEVARRELERLKSTVTGMCVRNCLDTLDDEGRRCVAEASTEDGIKRCKMEAQGRNPKGTTQEPKTE